MQKQAKLVTRNLHKQTHSSLLNSCSEKFYRAADADKVGKSNYISLSIYCTFHSHAVIKPVFH